MNIKKIKNLEEKLEGLKEQLKRVTIDMDNPEYAIYKREQWNKNLQYLNINLYDLKPVNKTAQTHEIEKLTMYRSGYRNDEIYKEDYNALINTPLSKKKQIYVKDPHYLIFKIEPWKSIMGIPLFKPINKEAEEYEEKNVNDTWKSKNFAALIYEGYRNAQK